MPLFMDVHEKLPAGATARDIAGAHTLDRSIQDQCGVTYLQCGVDEADGKAFCLVQAPDAAAAEPVHREAHGLLADRIYPVVQGRP